VNFYQQQNRDKGHKQNEESNHVNLDFNVANGISADNDGAIPGEWIIDYSEPDIDSLNGGCLRRVEAEAKKPLKLFKSVSF
jgi:hypothetical protein